MHEPADHRIVEADIEDLHFAGGSPDGAWGAKSDMRLAKSTVPMALHDLHRACGAGARIGLRFFLTDRKDSIAESKVPAPLFSSWSRVQLSDVLAGAGFGHQQVHHVAEVGLGGVHRSIVLATRMRTLADTVGPNMRLLVCGLNPSLNAADAGYGFASPSNRFWKAATAAGLVTTSRDPTHALHVDGIGMSDLVKRATPRASEVKPTEFRDGLARLDRLCQWLQPRAVCVVGITGWRASIGDGTAGLGLQPITLGSRPVYVMPNPSGLNAHTHHDDLVCHFEAALRAADVAT